RRCALRRRCLSAQPGERHQGLLSPRRPRGLRLDLLPPGYGLPRRDLPAHLRERRLRRRRDLRAGQVHVPLPELRPRRGLRSRATPLRHRAGLSRRRMRPRPKLRRRYLPDGLRRSHLQEGPGLRRRPLRREEEVLFWRLLDRRGRGFAARHPPSARPRRAPPALAKRGPPAGPNPLPRRTGRRPRWRASVGLNPPMRRLRMPPPPWVGELGRTRIVQDETNRPRPW